VEDDDAENGYRYTVGICVSADIESAAGDDKFKTAGAIQEHKKHLAAKHDQLHIVGSIEYAEIMSGSEYDCSCRCLTCA